MQRLGRKEKEKMGIGFRVLGMGCRVWLFDETRYGIECCGLYSKMAAEWCGWIYAGGPPLFQMQYILCIYGGTRDTICHPVTSRFIGGAESTTSYICHADKHQIKNQT